MVQLNLREAQTSSSSVVLSHSHAPRFGFNKSNTSKVAWSVPSTPSSSPLRTRAPRCELAGPCGRAGRAHHYDARGLRSFLLNATAGSSSYTASSALQQLLDEKLSLPASSFDQWWPAAADPWSEVSIGKEALALAELSAGLDSLLTVLTRQEAAKLLLTQPRLVAAPLSSWRGFFDAMQFSHAEQRNMFITCPELMVQGDIVTAGAAIRHLCDLGFDEDGVRHKVVAWCPQVLTMSQDEITNLIRLWSKFSVGVDERAGM